MHWNPKNSLLCRWPHERWSWACIPIILVEAIFTAHGTTPWLRLPGFVGVAVLFIGGAVWLGQSVAQANGFVASAPQLLGTAIVIVTFSSAAFTLRDRARAPVRQGVPNPWMTGGLAFITSSLFMLTEVLPGWTRVGACIFIAAAGFIVIFRWAQRSTWNALHTLSLAGGALLTYAWLGALMEPETGPKTSIDHLGTLVLIVAALWLVIVAAENLRRSYLQEMMRAGKDRHNHTMRLP